MAVMVDKKITDLDPTGVTDLFDLAFVVADPDGAALNKKITIANLFVLPIGQLYTKDGSDTQTPDTSYALMDQWASGGLSTQGILVDAANNKITVELTGVYAVFFQTSFTGTNGSLVDAEVFWDGVGQDSIGFSRKLGIGGGADVGSASGFGLVAVTSPNTDFDLRVKCDGATDVFDLVRGQLVVVRIGGTGMELWGSDIVSQATVVDLGTLEQNHVFVGMDIESGNPVVQLGTLEQNHVFVGTDITGGAPVLATGIVIADSILVGQDTEAQATDVGTGTLNQGHIFTGTDSESGSPTLDNGTLSQNHVLVGADITGGAPVLDTGIMDILDGADIMAGAPVLDTATLTEDTNSEITGGQDITAGIPVLDTGTVTPG